MPRSGLIEFLRSSSRLSVNCSVAMTGTEMQYCETACEQRDTSKFFQELWWMYGALPAFFILEPAGCRVITEALTLRVRHGGPWGLQRGLQRLRSTICKLGSVSGGLAHQRGDGKVNPHCSTLNPHCSTLNPHCSTLNPHCSTLNPHWR
jgi:hypothetical protein